MARPVVGIYASVAPASWGPWFDRPSALAPAALGSAVQRAGAIVVLLAPDPGLDELELLGTLDALIVFDDAGAVQLAALRAAARELGLAILVLDAARMTPATTVEDYEREIRGLLTAS
ncbi:MAG TPA: hypothetical protein VGO80_09290 [Solirubrobacteraceae bacterium]|jgi:hypothetical protein|nr:hypothetical protein [Solirubrobacteraceae bacterium]